MTQRIETSFAFPPIPCRDFDWCAWFDNLGADCSPYGWGRTEVEAIDDLLANAEDDDEFNEDALRAIILARAEAERARKSREDAEADRLAAAAQMEDDFYGMAEERRRHP